jgi:hypothetical protein
MAAAMLDAQRGQIQAFMGNSRAGSAVSLGPAEMSLHATEATPFSSALPHSATPGPPTPPPAVSQPLADDSAQPRRMIKAPHNSFAEPLLGEEQPPPPPSGAAALLGCTTSRAATPAPPPADAAGEGLVASAAQRLFGLFG